MATGCSGWQERAAAAAICAIALLMRAPERRTGVADVVEALAQQLRRLGDCTLHEAEGVRVHVAGQQRLDQRGAGGRHLGRLEHCDVAGGDSGDERVQQHLDGEVPGADNQHHAQRLALDVRAARDQHRRRDGLQGRKRWGPCRKIARADAQRHDKATELDDMQRISGT